DRPRSPPRLKSKVARSTGFCGSGTLSECADAGSVGHAADAAGIRSSGCLASACAAPAEAGTRSASRYNRRKLARPRWLCDSGAMILLIDNYDSFTYNLVQRLGEIDSTLDLEVVRNDQITLDEIEKLRPERIIISPGPCTPHEAGISKQVVERF